jgi:hypothetical protein
MGVVGQNTGVAALVTHALLLTATVAVAVFNGFGLSPVFDSVDYMLRVTLRGYPYMTGRFINDYVTPVAISVMTLAIAGIPAAVYERVRGLKASTAVSLGLWLAVAVLLAWPAIQRALTIADDFR